MRAGEVLVHGARVMVVLASSSADANGSVIAVYGMVSLLGAAFLTGLFGFLTSRYGVKDKGRTAGAVTRAQLAQLRHYPILILFLANNDIDPRRIRTGYERVEDVRNGPTP